MQKNSGKSTLDSIEKEDTVQAVIIANFYDDNFCPVVSNIAPCLIPVVNRPLLDYTLHCLSSARVQEVIVFCSSHAEQIKEFIKNGIWGRMSVSVVVSEGCRSLGDALRDLDARVSKGDLGLRGDFILLNGPIIGSLDLLAVLEVHKKRLKVDKGAAMTIVYKECGKRSKSNEDKVYLAIDRKTSRILLHQKFNKNSKKVNIPIEVFSESTDLDVRCDLLDTRVAICSVSVLPLFSDNFDFQTRDDFIRGLLVNEDILASTVYAYFLQGSQYAAGPTNWQNYHMIAHDIIHRWTYPQVPDCFFDEFYSYRRKNVYIQDNVTVEKSAVLEDVVIGAGSSLFDGCRLSETIVGRNCTIGSKTSVQHCHLFNNVTVEAGCTLEYCVVGEGCIIKEGAQIRDCVLGPGVVISQGQVIGNMPLQSVPDDKSEKEERRLGDKAFIYQPPGDSDSESDDEDECGASPWVGLRNEDHSSEEEDLEGSEIDSEAEFSDRASPMPDDTNLFFSEVVDSLLRGFEDKLPCDNLILEVNSSRYAYNVTVREVNYFVIKAILTLTDNFSWDAVLARITYFTPLITNYIRSADAMMDCLTAIEDTAEYCKPLSILSVKILNKLYDKDVLDEDAILKWHKSPKEDSEFSLAFRKLVSPFIKWLEEADEQSDSDEDD